MLVPGVDVPRDEFQLPVTFTLAPGTNVLPVQIKKSEETLSTPEETEYKISESLKLPLAVEKLVLVIDEPVSCRAITVLPYTSNPAIALVPESVTVFPCTALLSIYTRTGSLALNPPPCT